MPATARSRLTRGAAGARAAQGRRDRVLGTPSGRGARPWRGRRGRGGGGSRRQPRRARRARRAPRCRASRAARANANGSSPAARRGAQATTSQAMASAASHDPSSRARCTVVPASSPRTSAGSAISSWVMRDDEQHVAGPLREPGPPVTGCSGAGGGEDGVAEIGHGVGGPYPHLPVERGRRRGEGSGRPGSRRRAPRSARRGARALRRRSGRRSLPGCVDTTCGGGRPGRAGKFPRDWCGGRDEPPGARSRARRPSRARRRSSGAPRARSGGSARRCRTAVRPTTSPRRPTCGRSARCRPSGPTSSARTWLLSHRPAHLRGRGAPAHPVRGPARSGAG